MDKQQKKKRKRGPYLKNTSEAEDESELTLSVDSSFANLQEETDEVLKEQTTSSSSSNRLRVTSPVASAGGKTNTRITHDDHAVDSTAQFSGR